MRENTRAEVMQAIADLDKQRAQLRLVGRRYLIDVVMQNEPVPTAGHWNIMDIYSPGQQTTHVAIAID